MDSDRVKGVTGLIGFALLASFILGLAHSISTGFAGFWGGFPFWVIAVSVLALAAYDYWDECLRKSG
jgi:sterol desaturase/sphingolipid hydroxylase (fatty acid hydroxylase superfamily)